MNVTLELMFPTDVLKSVKSVGNFATSSRLNTCTLTHTVIYVYVRTYVRTHVGAHTHARTHARTHTHTHTCLVCPSLCITLSTFVNLPPPIHSFELST